MKVKVESLSRVWLFTTPPTIAYQVPLSTGFSRQEYWSELPFPSAGIFPTQGLNLGLPYCRQTLYHLNHRGSPKIGISCKLFCIWKHVCFLSASYTLTYNEIVVVQLLRHVQLFVTPWTAAFQASLSFTISCSLLNSCPLNWWCHPTISSFPSPFLLPSVFPSIRVFFNESALHIRKYLVSNVKFLSEG